MWEKFQLIMNSNNPIDYGGSFGPIKWILRFYLFDLGFFMRLFTSHMGDAFFQKHRCELLIILDTSLQRGGLFDNEWLFDHSSIDLSGWLVVGEGCFPGDMGGSFRFAIEAEGSRF